MSKKISELTAATTPLAGTELIEVVQGGVNKKVAASEFGDISLGTNILPVTTTGTDRSGQVYLEKTQNAAIDNTSEISELLRVRLFKTADVTANVLSAFTVRAQNGDTSGTGGLHAINAIVSPFKQSNPDEATPLFVYLIGEGTGRLWGTDQAVVGPTAVQANLIMGASIFMANRHSGAVTSKSIGLNITAGKSGEGQAPTETWENDYGILINGRTGAGATTRAAFTVGLGIGQAGGGWFPATAGKVGTGIELTNIDTLGISYIGTDAAAVGMRLRGHASQTGDLLQAQSSAGTNLSRILASGEMRISMAARSTLSMVSPGQPTIFGRVTQGANSGAMHITENASSDGTNWNRDDNSSAVASMVVSAGSGLIYRTAGAAAGAITFTNVLRATPAGNVVVGAAAIATSATDGFFYAPTMAGTPSGTPTEFAGMVPMVVDTSNNRLYIRVGATWRYASLT